MDRILGAQWLSGRVLDLRPRGRGFEPRRRQCVVSLSKTHLSLLSTGSTQEDVIEKLLTGGKELNQTNKLMIFNCISSHTAATIVTSADDFEQDLLIAYIYLTAKETCIFDILYKLGVKY